MHSSARAAVVMLLSLSAITVLGQQPISFQPGPLGRISGRVVDADSSQPVAGARVSLSDPGRRRQAIADDNGRFVFEAVPAGVFELLADLEGYRGSEFGQRQPRGSWQWFDLADGEQVADVALKMWRMASLSGTVLSEGGQPAPGVTVQALRKIETEGHARFSIVGRPCVTDPRGSYFLSDLTPGDYVLAATASRHGGSFDRGAASLTLTTYAPSALVPGDATVLTLRSGEDRRNVEIRRRPLPAHTVSGRLTDPPGGQTIPLHLVPTDSTGYIAPLATLSTFAASDGTFSFQGVPPGAYTLSTVVVPRAQYTPGSLSLRQELGTDGQSFGFPNSERGSPIARPPDAPTYWVASPLNVGDADVNAGDILIRQAARISGRVEFDPAGDRPTVEQMRRTPLIVMESNRSDLGTFPAGAIEADGRFRMVGLPPGQYSIWILSLLEGGMRGWITASVRQGARELSGATFDLGTTDITDVVVTLTTRPTRISGVARDETGRVDPDAMLYVFPADRSRWGALEMNAHWPIVMRPARSGKYTTYGLAPGGYVVSALSSDAPDPPRTSADVERILRAGVPVTVSPNETHALDLVVRRWQP
ncbi:MAG TPA: carboxypeptidase-like regulatory domain-containing protein [Vicinamibacterales bacterium]|nr:carboxypeptidase-like regulatory domain-containing protein [Vicinamibacterales bacterium]